jgi:hypothetical protein
MCNRVANACYKMYNYMAAYVREKADAFENAQMFGGVQQNDLVALDYLGKGDKATANRIITEYTVSTAQKQFSDWVDLEETLLVKFIDGNVKAQNPDGSFRHSQYSAGIPDGLTQPGYTDHWKAVVAGDHGNVLEVK